jgi:hypothetical protein
MQTKYIIAASVVLGLFSLSIMALVTRILLHTKDTDNGIDSTDGSSQQLHHLLKISTSWKRMFASKQVRERESWVPTLSGIIKAGDEGLFSSALFANLHGHPGEPSLQALYEVFAKELRSRPMTERSTYAGGIPQFLSSTRRIREGAKEEPGPLCSRERIRKNHVRQEAGAHAGVCEEWLCGIGGRWRVYILDEGRTNRRVSLWYFGCYSDAQRACSAVDCPGKSTDCPWTGRACFI